MCEIALQLTMVHFQDTFTNFEILRKEEILWDVELQVENEFFKLHKFLLSASSQYFKTLFTIDMRERSQEVVTIHGVSADTFKQVILFIYNGNAALTPNNLEDVLQASCMLQILNLKKLCMSYMNMNLSTENCLFYFLLSKIFSCRNLHCDILNYLYENAEDIALKSTEFCLTDKEFISSFLSSDNIQVSDEIILYRALIKWVEFDPASRRQYFCELLRLVRLPNISNSFFAEVLDNTDVLKCNTCLDYAQRSLQFQENKESLTLPDDHTRVRGLGQILIVSKKCQRFKTLYIRNGKCSSVAIPHIPMKSFFKSAVVCGAKLRLLGGMNKQQAFTCDFKRGKAWSQLPSMSIKRNYSCGFCITMKHKENVYVIGGSSGGIFLSDMECYSDVESKWSVLPNMMTARCDISGAGLVDDIYVIGGWNGEYLNTVEKYNTVTNTWVKMAHLQTERSCATAICLNGMIYVMGGRNNSGNLASVEIYNTEKNEWATFANLNFTRINLGACITDGTIYVVGGDTNSTASSYEYLDTASQKWIASKDQNTHGYCRAFSIA